MRILVRLAVLAPWVLAACTVAPSPSVSSSSSPSPLVASPSASLVAPPIATLWTRDDSDPNPGGVVVGGIASALGVPPDAVVAAVFLFSHPAGNGASIWVFRARGLTSLTAAERWAAFESRCPAAAQSGVLADRPTFVIRHAVAGQCEPEYLVQLDDQTVAMIIDDGAFHGTANPTVPYRPAIEIAQLVVWLQQNLPTIPLMTGGPIPANG